MADGVTLLCSTTATGLLRDRAGRVLGVRTDRPDGDVTAPVVIACDGVNSLLAKEAGLYGKSDPHHYTLGVKQTIALPRTAIEERFGVHGREGVDIEIIGGTGTVSGGAFIYTNLDTIAVGVVLSMADLAASTAAGTDHRRVDAAPRDLAARRRRRRVGTVGSRHPRSRAGDDAEDDR